MSKKSIIASSATLALASLVGAAAAQAEFLPSDGFYADVRIRHENVDQDGIAKDANANTIRTNFGYKSGISNGFQFLVEGQDVASIGSTKFNNTTNGKGMYPVVADPVGTELNQAWVAYSGFSDTVIKVGRQGINLDNQRFIGTVGWRQNDQNYDSVVITNSSIDNLSLIAVHVDKVRRIFGEDDVAKGEIDTNTNIINGTYKVSDSLSVTGYGYFLDHDDMAFYGLSSKTYGVRVTGNTPLNDDWKFVYVAEAAEQSDYKDYTKTVGAITSTSYDATYYHIAPAIQGKGWTLGIGFESLEGDGVSSFQTPLATLHAQNGWADKFLTTPAGGLEDSYVKAVYKVKGQDNILDGTKIVAVYHEFDAENSGTSYGDELDIVISHPLNVGNIGFLKSGSIALKYADYNSDGNAAFKGDVDTQKLWVTTKFKF
jgi:Alginate export